MEVLEDFMADNVIYLELRSTPRTLEGNIVINIYDTEHYRFRFKHVIRSICIDY